MSQLVNVPWFNDFFEEKKTISPGKSILECFDIIAKADSQNSTTITKKEQYPEPLNVDKLLDIRGPIGFTCGKCNAADIRYRLIATRSADEGMTTHCECRKCGYVFRIRA